jgi:hypothetical protein
MVLKLKVTIVQSPSLTVREAAVTLKEEQFPDMHELYNDVCTLLNLNNQSFYAIYLFNY